MPDRDRSDLERALVAGAYYFQIVFAIGFGLGTLRALVVAPRVGEASAVLLELPIILAASWYVAGVLVARFRIGKDQRLVMGFFAFALLMLAEAVLSVVLFGRTISDHLAHYRTFAGAAGLAGQVLFALVPAMRPDHRRS